jgi:hypothetical protein
MLFNSITQIIFLLRIFSLLCNVCNANAVPIDDIKQNGLEKNAGYNNFEIRVMYGFDLAVLQLGIICTLYMIIRTFIRWFKHDLSLHMSHKLPFYMALSGNYSFSFFLSFRKGLNHNNNLKNFNL